jgi:hypothetical protein
MEILHGHLVQVSDEWKCGWTFMVFSLHCEPQLLAITWCELGRFFACAHQRIGNQDKKSRHSRKNNIDFIGQQHNDHKRIENCVSGASWKMFEIA